MHSSRGRLAGLLRHAGIPTLWSGAGFELTASTQKSSSNALEVSARCFGSNVFQSTPGCSKVHEHDGWLWRQSPFRGCTTSERSRMEFEDVMHKRRVFSKIMMRLSTRYKAKVKRFEFKEGVEAQSAMLSTGKDFFKDCVDVVGRFRDDMDHINAATVIHRIGCIAICYSDKAWMVDEYQNLIVDFANFLSRQELVDKMELRQAVMCFWGLSTFGPTVKPLKLSQSSDETVEDCLMKLQAQIPRCEQATRNGNNICSVIEAASMSDVPLHDATLEFLLDAAPSLIDHEDTSPQNVVAMIRSMAKLGMEDRWNILPSAVDVVTKKSSKLKMDEIAKTVKALGDMGFTDYGQFMDEVEKIVQFKTDYSDHLMSSQDVADFADGLASLGVSEPTHIMDYLVNDIKRRHNPPSASQLNLFKMAAEKLDYEVPADLLKGHSLHEASG